MVEIADSNPSIMLITKVIPKPQVQPIEPVCLAIPTWIVDTSFIQTLIHWIQNLEVLVYEESVYMY